MTPPKAWENVTLDDVKAPGARSITDGPFGSNLKTAHYTDAGPQVVRLQNIGEGKFKEAPAHISQERFERLRAHEVQPGDLLVASLGEVLPRACLMPAHIGPAIVKADCIRVRLSDDVDPRWVMYSLLRPEARKWAEAYTHGVGRPRLGLKLIRQIPLPLPPLDEQRQIVEILEDHLSRLDSGSAQLDDVRRRVDAYLAAEVSDALNSAGGHELSLGSLLRDLSNGIFVSRAGTEPDGVPILRIGAVRPLALDLTAIGYSRLSAAEVLQRGADVVPGDLLFTRYNGNPNYVGAAARVPHGVGPMTYPDKLIRVRVDRDRVMPEFVELAVNYGPTRQEIRSKVKTTAGQAGISGRELKSVHIRVPALAAQSVVVQRSTSALEASRRLQQQVADASTRARTLRRALLAAAFSGRLAGSATDIERVEMVAGV